MKKWSELTEAQKEEIALKEAKSHPQISGMLERTLASEKAAWEKADELQETLIESSIKGYEYANKKLDEGNRQLNLLNKFLERSIKATNALEEARKACEKEGAAVSEIQKIVSNALESLKESQNA